MVPRSGVKVRVPDSREDGAVDVRLERCAESRVDMLLRNIVTLRLAGSSQVVKEGWGVKP